MLLDKGLRPDDLLAAENDGTTPQKLAVNLLNVLFDKKEISEKNCT